MRNKSQRDLAKRVAIYYLNLPAIHRHDNYLHLCYDHHDTIQAQEVSR